MKRILLIVLGVILVAACTKAQYDDEGYPDGYPRLRTVGNAYNGQTVTNLNLAIDRANYLTLKVDSITRGYIYSIAEAYASDFLFFDPLTGMISHEDTTGFGGGSGGGTGYWGKSGTGLFPLTGGDDVIPNGPGSSLGLDGFRWEMAWINNIVGDVISIQGTSGSYTQNEGNAIFDGLDIYNNSQAYFTGINESVTTDVVYYNSATGKLTYGLAPSGGGTSLWQRNGTELSPLNGGDDVLVPNGSNLLLGANNSYFTEVGSGIIDLYIAGSVAQEFQVGQTVFYGNIMPNLDNARDLGSAPVYWRNVYQNSAYFATTGHRIYRLGDDLMFDDPNNSPTSLTQMLAGGSAYLGGNAITLTGNTFDFGGFMTGTAFVSNNGLYDLSFENYSLLDLSSTRIQLHDDGRLTINSWENETFNSSSYSTINMWKGIMTLSYNGVISSNSWTLNASGILVDTEISGSGILGASYYGDVAVDNSFVQLRKVQEMIDASTGNLPGDSIQGSTIYHNKKDLLYFGFGKGGTVDTDDILGVLEVAEDSIFFREIKIECTGASADMDIQLFHGPTWTGAGTAINAAVNVVTGAESTTTTFIVPNLPPGDDVWAKATTVTTSSTMLVIKLFYNETNNY